MLGMMSILARETTTITIKWLKGVSWGFMYYDLVRSDWASVMRGFLFDYLVIL